MPPSRPLGSGADRIKPKKILALSTQMSLPIAWGEGEHKRRNLRIVPSPRLRGEN